jgi:hypothetical protein
MREIFLPALFSPKLLLAETRLLTMLGLAST